MQTLRARNSCDLNKPNPISGSHTAELGLVLVCSLEIPAEPHSRAHAKAKLSQNLILRPEDLANPHWVEVLGLVARVGLLFVSTVLGNCLESIVERDDQ